MKQQRTSSQTKQRQMIEEILQAQKMASLLSKDDIYKELETLKNRVNTTRLNTKHHRNYLKPERITLSALQQELSWQLKGKEKRDILRFFLSTIPTAIIYLGMYFALIPKGYYEANQLLYLSACCLVLCAWLGWFLFIRGAYKYLFTHRILPYMLKYPSIASQTSFAANSLYILITMNPLFQSALFAGTTITPSWSTFFSNLRDLTIEVWSGNPITAVANFIAVTTALLASFTLLQRKRRKR